MSPTVPPSSIAQMSGFSCVSSTGILAACPIQLPIARMICGVTWNGLTQIIASSLALVDLAHGDMVVPSQANTPYIARSCPGQGSTSPPSSSTNVSPCSVGAIVPASMFIYESILIIVTFKLIVLSNRPMLEAFL